MSSPFTECFLCEETIKMGAGVFQGRQVPQWGILVCNRCRAANAAGFAPGAYPKLEKHLAANGIEPARNPKGLILWP
jgi:hypothetical protein